MPESPDPTPGSELTGPWWFNDEALDPDREYPPQEAFFRLEFSGEATAFQIATGCFYQTWLNGMWFGYGPARASHGRLTIDRWELPQPLAEQNVITIQAFWGGVFTFENVRGEPGIWIGLEGLASEASALLVSEQTGRMATHRFAHVRGWAEEIDARARAVGWPLGEWDPEQWRPAVGRPNLPVVLEARDIQPFVNKTRRAAHVAFAGAADVSKRTPHRILQYEEIPGFGIPADNPSGNIHEEALLPSAAVDGNLAGLTESGGGPAVLSPDPGGFDRTVQLDFGNFISGMLILEITAPAGTVVDVGWSEIPWNPESASRWSASGQPAGAVTPREGNDSRQGARYICSGGRDRFDGLFLAAFGSIRLAFRTPADAREESIVLHEFSVRVAGYPIEREGDFRSSDSTLNRIYAGAVETMENSIHDVFMDCPSRERAGWLNDSYWMAIGMNAVSADIAFDRRFIRQFIDSLAHNEGTGSVFPMYPADTCKWPGGRKQQPILCHTLYWMLQAERHLRLFGDKELRDAWREGLTSVVNALDAYRSTEGLLENVPWDEFIDWSSIEGGPLRTWTNCIYGLMLVRLGETDDNTEWVRDGKQTLAAAEAMGWNEGRYLYADALKRDGSEIKPGDRFSELANYIAIWTGAVPPEREEMVWRQLRRLHPRSTDTPLTVEESGLTRCNAIGVLYRFDILGRRGEIADLIRDLGEAYLPMLERGQTTLSEHFANHFSHCHGLQGYIAHVIARYVGGIQLPEQPGGVVRLRPNPALIAWTQTRLPWMGGNVQLWCARCSDSEADVLISLPAGQRGELLIGSQEPIAFESTLQTRVRFKL